MKNNLLTLGNKADKFVKLLNNLCIINNGLTHYRIGGTYLYTSEYTFNWWNPLTYLFVIPMILINLVLCIGYGLYQFFNTSLTIKQEH